MADYVVTDIHGCVLTFRKLIEEKIGLRKGDRLFLLGDYIDRGPDSKCVIDYILDLTEQGFSLEVLMGNHEEMLLRCLDQPEYIESWQLNGGAATLNSFKVQTINQIPEKYIFFLRSLKKFTSWNNCLLVHAGFNFGIENIFEDEVAMLWARDYTVAPEKTGNKIVIHGHTPKPFGDLMEIFEKREQNFEINLDNGCVYKQIPGLGNLFALRLDDMGILFQPNIDF